MAALFVCLRLPPGPLGFGLNLEVEIRKLFGLKSARMCGRQCLTLDPKQICCACKYSTCTNDEKKVMEPEWRPEHNLGRKYEPCFNIAPTDITPVLVSAKHFDESADGDQRVLVPMMWAMIPFWHRGDDLKHGLTTNNCRLETLTTSKMYGRAFAKGQRCVIVCEGFYEWQTTTGAKKASQRPAFFIHSPQSEKIGKIYDKDSWNGELVNLMKIAGLYDIWTDSSGATIYSYTVITYESNDVLDWLHHRTPAILETEQQVSDWLDFERVQGERALAALKPPKLVCSYQVSNEVNNSRNKSNRCNKPLDQKDIKGAASTPKQSNLLTSWLIKGGNKRNNVKRNSGDDEVKKVDEDSVEVRDIKRFKNSQ